MKPAARRRARECAVQALYSWQLSHNDIADVEYQFLSEQDVKDVDVLYFRELLSGVATNSAYLDGLMKPYLSRLLEELGKVPGITVYPSDSNYILFKLEGADKVWEALYERGILVRDFSHAPMLENCLRVSVGTEEENDEFLAALREIVASK